MKIQLPNGQQVNLDDDISLEKKKKIAHNLTKEWYPTLKRNWNSNSVKFFLDSLANYLVWHKEPEEKGKEDKEILSRGKLEKMNKLKSRSKTVNFSDLSKDDKELLFGEEVRNDD
ncbi:hypothetical protein AB3N02_22305 [Priestia aryabhattai]|uniref:hypothetical protein n=1 Tax=Priestia aryabhattai TaxID=412384 RepID=UPI00399F8FE9